MTLRCLLRGLRFSTLFAAVLSTLLLVVSSAAAQDEEAPGSEETPPPADDGASSGEGSGGGGGESLAAPSGLQRGSRMEFDGRLIRGETARAGAVFLFERAPRPLPSMVKLRDSFLVDTVESVFTDRLERPMPPPELVAEGAETDDEGSEADASGGDEPRPDVDKSKKSKKSKKKKSKSKREKK